MPQRLCVRVVIQKDGMGVSQWPLGCVLEGRVGHFIRRRFPIYSARRNFPFFPPPSPTSTAGDQLRIKMSFEKSKAGYDGVAVEDTEELLSSTEVDDLDCELAIEEKQWHAIGREAQKKKSRTRACLAGFRRHRWLVDTLLLLINISLSMLLVRDVWQEKSVGTIQIGGDVTGAGPDCEYNELTAPDSSFE